MTVSLCIIAKNEEKVISGLLEQVKNQTYPKDKTEIVLVDSGSTDGTKGIFEKFAEENKSEYTDVKIGDNTGGNQATGWNEAIKTAMGDVIIRVDAHAEIPENFIEKNVELIESGEYVCGGARPSKIDEPTAFKEMLFLAESSMFGSSIAGYRRKSEGKKYVNSLFHGAYRREVFAKVGGFNKDLGRTEDNEMHYRIRKAGYKICQSDEIISYQHIRNTLGGMIKQKFGNGKWVGMTLGVCYQCLSSFHFVPFLFVLTLICSGAVAVAGGAFDFPMMKLPFIAVISAYALADLLMTVLAVITAKKKHIIQILLPIVFLILHISYGVGTFVGLVIMPFWKMTLGKSAKSEIEEVKRCVIENTKFKGDKDGTADNDNR